MNNTPHRPPDRRQGLSGAARTQAQSRLRAAAEFRRARKAKYLRRRIVVGLVALIVLLALVWGIVGIVKGLSQRSTNPTDSGQVVPTTEAEAPLPDPEAAGGYCSPESIGLAVWSSEKSIGPDQRPVFTGAVSNNQDADCVVDVTHSKQEYVLKQGQNVAWSSRYCQAQDAEGSPTALLMPAGERREATMEWPRVKVNDRCERQSEDFAPGDYDLVFRLADKESAPYRVTITGPTDSQSEGEDQ